MLSKKVNNTRISIVSKKLYEMQVDLIYLWTTPSLTEGDEVFVQTHKEASSTVFKECQNYMVNSGNQIDIGSVILTKAGLIPYVRFILHCVIPNHRIISQDKIKQTLFLETIKKSCYVIEERSKDSFVRKIGIPNISETLYGTVTDEDIKCLFETFITAINKNEFKHIKDIVIVCENEVVEKQYEKVFISLTYPWYEKILTKLFGK